MLLLGFISNWFESQLGDIVSLAAALTAVGVLWKFIIAPFWAKFASPILLKNAIRPLVKDLTDGNGELSGPFRAGINQIIKEETGILSNQLATIVAEVTPNGGGSLKDMVKSVYQNQEFIIGVIHEAKKYAESNNVELKERFRVLSTFTPAGIYETDENGKCVYVNIGWQQLTGLSYADAMGDDWINAISPKYHEDVLLGWKHAIENKADFGPIDYEYLRPDGTTIPVRGSATILKDKEGVVAGWLGIVNQRL